MQEKKGAESMRSCAWVAVALVCCLSVVAMGADTMSVQGLLKGSAGVPLASGMYNMQFGLYTVASGGTAEWTEAHDGANAVTVTAGMYRAELGGITVFPATLFSANPDLWLEVAVDMNGDTTFEETFLPRSKLTSAPYAHEAKNAQALQGQAASAFSAATHNHDAAYVNDNAGEVGDADVPTGALSADRIIGTAWTSSNDGSGSGLDADLLDGQHAAAFAGATHNHDTAYVNDNAGEVGDADVPVGALSADRILGTAWTGSNDGTGSGLDADLLDGQEAAAFAPAIHGHFSESWSSSGSNYGLRIENIDTGCGFYAFTHATALNYAALYGENMGTGSGVYATSSLGCGVYGQSGGYYGVEGLTNASGLSGVYGHSADSYGVIGESTNTFGVKAEGNDTSNSDTFGDLVLGGNIGEIFSPGGIMDLFSNASVFIDLDDNNDQEAMFQILNGSDASVFQVDESGNTSAPGTKSARVKTASHGQRLLYTMESPGVWFEDFGTAALVNGEAAIGFEPIFAETVNLDADYHVFLTPVSEDPVLLRVASKTAKGFTVRGVTLNGMPSSCSFDYRIAAKRKGYEDVRLAIVPEIAVK
jgi:hypothetical protein